MHMGEVFDFDHPHEDRPSTLAPLLGGKGARLAEMAGSLGMPVPPGFTVSTAAADAIAATGSLDAHRRAIADALERLGARLGRRFGDPQAPLIVSVRSGAPRSMPGMLDTVLNLGITPEVATAMAAAPGDEAFAWDCYRRFVAAFGATVLDAATPVAAALTAVEEASARPLERIARLAAALSDAGVPVPSDPWDQLDRAVLAVVSSWRSPRAVAYRRVEGIPDEPGTAVNVQTMVFGNRDDRSCTGVAFSRDPATGTAGLVGEVLFGAQGEDVVSGRHRPASLDLLTERLPEVASELAAHADALERHLGDMVDIEFTVESGRLWLLQVRPGARTPGAALRIAVDLADDPTFPLTRADAVRRVAPLLAHPPVVAESLAHVAPDHLLEPGVAASPGVAVGRACFDADAVVATAARGEPAVLVRPTTSPDDVHGMAEAAAVITALGGTMSHAAVVARGWGIPAVVGVERLHFATDGVRLGDRLLAPGDWITVDGGSGLVATGAHEVPAATMAPEVATLTRWAAQVAEGTEGPDTQRAGGPLPVDLRDATLFLVALRTWARADRLAHSLDVDEEVVATVVDQLHAEGRVELDPRRGLRLTPAGNDLAVGLLATERQRLGADARTALEAFSVPNQRAKEIFTAWQLRETPGGTVANTHDDGDYDAAVVSRLESLHVDVAGWLPTISDRAALVRLHERRLDRAVQQLRAGDHRFLTSPRVDSYHHVWFELHEHLIRLAGVARVDEAAAGRA